MEKNSRPFEIDIAGRKVGDNHPSFIIAEIGGNFRTLDEAFEEIRLAAVAGADAVKIQTFRADTLVTKEASFTNIAGGANQYQLFKQYEVSEEWHREIAACAKKHNLLFFSTPSYFDDVDLLMKIGVPVIKTGSDDMTNLPFLRYIGSTKKPVLLSTGMADLDEVSEAVEAIRSTGNNQIAVLHCVSQYPVKDEKDLNLRAIPVLREKLGVTVGFSDHSEGNFAPLLAVALGASMIEKHFTLTKSLPTPDSFFSADPVELKLLVEEIRRTEKAMGVFRKQPTPQEKAHRVEIRKSLFAKKKISKGETITADSLIIKRPGTGIQPKEFDKAVGKRALSDIVPDEMLTWEKIG